MQGAIGPDRTGIRRVGEGRKIAKRETNILP